MKSKLAAIEMLTHSSLPREAQVQQLWKLYFNHSHDVVRVRFQPGSGHVRKVRIGCMPALKKELGAWLLAVTNQAGIDWLAANANDVFFEQLFPGTGAIIQFGNPDAYYP